jgi:hypothetical protein
VAGVTVEQTQQILDRYFGLMGKDEDFAVCFTADVTWLVAETDEVIKGPHVVRDYITALHSRMVGGHGFRTVVGEGFVYLEGDCAATGPAAGRINYCIAYEMRDELIARIRCYGLGAV